MIVVRKASINTYHIVTTSVAQTDNKNTAQTAQIDAATSCGSTEDLREHSGTAQVAHNHMLPSPVRSFRVER